MLWQVSPGFREVLSAVSTRHWPWDSPVELGPHWIQSSSFQSQGAFFHKLGCCKVIFGKANSFDRERREFRNGRHSLLAAGKWHVCYWEVTQPLLGITVRSLCPRPAALWQLRHQQECIKTVVWGKPSLCEDAPWEEPGRTSWPPCPLCWSPLGSAEGVVSISVSTDKEKNLFL